jgi:membrane-associated protease RseP (regulator of RpoE activity)
MRLIVQPIAGGFELCARLGLVLAPSKNLTGQTFAGGPTPLEGFFGGGRIVHAVLDGSPGARAGIEPRDIILTVDGTPWDSVRRLTFSDRRPSEITFKTFVARYFAFAKIAVRVPPEPYRLLDDIAVEAEAIIAARPTPDRTPYRNPRFDDMRELVARFSSRRGRCR